MPLPTPNKSEKKQDFVSRCAGSKVMNKEFPDQKQKLAVCYSQAKEDNNFEAKIDEVFAENDGQSSEKLEMGKVHSDEKHDYYMGTDKEQKPVYNIVPKGSQVPNSGYYNKEHIEGVKGKKFPIQK